MTKNHWHPAMEIQRVMPFKNNAWSCKSNMDILAPYKTDSLSMLAHSCLCKLPGDVGATLAFI